MSLKFAANLNFLFTENAPTILEKMELARQAGFQAVEIPFPDGNVLDSVPLVQEKFGLKCALINIALGSEELAFGSACITGAEDIFKKQLNETILLAKKMQCKKIHLMAGRQPKTGSYDDHLNTYISNLKLASTILGNENIIGVIEPINKYALPGYFMNNYDTAINIINEINSPHLKLMVDIFHLQHIRGNVTNTIKEVKSIIGHIQIAQVPHRNEPDCVGELNYSYIFDLIRECAYTDWIGCEYKPESNTKDGLKWLSKYGLQL